MASETGREARDGYSLISYDDGTFGWETAGGRSKAGYRSKGAASTQGRRARAAEVADLASADPGNAQVDTMLEEIRQRVSAEYLRAYEETQAKLEDYLSRFEAKDRIHAEAVERGEETAAEYAQWRKGQILVGERWQEMVDTLAEDYRNADRVAASIVNGYAPDAYALNHDYATFQVEKGSSLDTSYTLYSRATVERLIRDQPDLLPRAKVDGKKDLRWNRQHIASAVTQGVLQGEDLGQVSKRIRSVADMDYRASMRTAHTAMTSAQNAGRLDAYRRAAAMGIDVRKQWLATLDQRTRHSHRRLDDEVAGLDEAFSNGLMYPGDPSGTGGEVYNCRCTMVPDLPDYPAERVERASRLGNMSYEEWRGEHGRRVDTEFVIPPSVRDSVTAGDASEEWFEYSSANWMREYVRTGEAGSVTLEGDRLDLGERQRLAAMAEALQGVASRTLTRYRTLYWGMVLGQEEARVLFTPGSKVALSTLTSSATDEGMARIYANVENYSGDADYPVPVIVEIQKLDGVYGYDRDGAEVILPKGSEFRVTRNWMDERGTMHVSLYAKKGRNVLGEDDEWPEKTV